MNAFDYFFEHSKSSDRDFVIGPKETISYKQLYNDCISLSQYISSVASEEEMILIISPNNVFFITTYLAILKSGRICVPLNPEIEQTNLDHIIDECGAKRVFIHTALIKKFNIERLEKTTETDLTKIPAIQKSNPDNEFNSQQCAEIIFTSGSTGWPKGVMISHKNLITNTSSIIEYLNLQETDIMEVILPFYYCYGLSLLHTHLRVGGSIVLNNTFIFIGSVLNDLTKYQCTGLAGVPSHFQILLRKSDSFKSTKFPSLRYVTQAGGKLHEIFINEFREAHPEIDFYVMYGQTEATARLSYLPLEYLGKKTGSIGKGIPGVELKVVAESGQEVKPGELGQIIARGDNVMLGYLNNEKETAEIIREGWLYTGDLAIVDEEGFIFVTARQKDIIKVGGKRISPKEIEEVIVSLPEVIDCIIIAVEDDMLGESMKARITVDRKNLEKINSEYIKRYCAQKLAAYKIPKIIEVTGNINIAATGKKVKSMQTKNF